MYTYMYLQGPHSTEGATADEGTPEITAPVFSKSKASFVLIKPEDSEILNKSVFYEPLANSNFKDWPMSKSN